MIKASKKICLVYFLELLLMTSAEKCFISTQDQNLVQTLWAGNIHFTFNIYKSLPVDKNVFISPFSISVALAMTAIGAGGRTLSQMKDGLMLNQLSTDQNINQAYSAVLNSICSNSNFSLDTANKIFINNTFPIISSYKTTILNSYQSEAQNVDFLNNGDGAALAINRWVQKQTNNNIRNLFSPGSLDPLTTAILITTIYFKGTFQKQFEAKYTSPEDFFPINQPMVKVETMQMKSSLNYSENQELDCKMLQLNYEEERLALYIILPNEKDGLFSIRQALTSNSFNSMRSKMNEELVVLSLPKFNINYKQDLRDILKGVGMVDMFDDSKANFSRMTNSQRGLYLSRVVHQAVVAVDEEGTKAAEVNAVRDTYSKLVFFGPVKLFKADHPFIFVIYDTMTNMIIFMGNVINPSK